MGNEFLCEVDRELEKINGMMQVVCHSFGSMVTQSIEGVEGLL